MADPRLSAFRVSPIASGMDLLRSRFLQNPGTFVAATAATFYAGQLVTLDATQKVTVCTGTNVLGFSKYNKANGLYATVVGEYVKLTGVVASTLAHANLFAPAAGPSGGVTVAPSVGGTAYTEGGGGDYTVNYTNGTLVRTAGSTIVSGSYVYVTYLYPLTAADFDFEGRNFWNYVDDVSIQDGLVTVVQGRGTIFTTFFDPAETYAVNDKLYAGLAADGLSGYVTKKSAGGVSYIGRVFQTPTVDDPYLGVDYVGAEVA